MGIATPTQIWRGPRLLVPIVVEALVVNEFDRRQTRWSINPNNYTGIDRLEPVHPHPFASTYKQIQAGIHLHWGLPDALTRGDSSRGSGLAAFLKVPNRWLVIRIPAGRRNERETWILDDLKGWVIDSDYLALDGSNPYPLSKEDQARLGVPAVERGPWMMSEIGRQRPLEKWSEDSPTPPHLTALGPGDPAFAAYTAHCQNVFAFYDDLRDLRDPKVEADLTKHFTLSYLVCGWYANADAHRQEDPLFHEALTADDFKEILDNLGWSLAVDPDSTMSTNDVLRGIAASVGRTDGPGDGIPRQTLCHGLVFGVKWSGDFGQTNSGVPAYDTSARQLNEALKNQEGDPTVFKTDIPHIAVGNSHTDALAALLAYLLESDPDSDDTIDMARLYQALEQGLLDHFDKPGGMVALDQALHSDWFAADSGGTHWELVKPPQEAVAPRGGEPVAGLAASSANGRGNGNPPSAEIDPLDEKLAALQDDLDALNAAQAQVDSARRWLRSKQDRFYTLWWKEKRLPHVSRTVVGAPSDAFTSFSTELERAAEKVKSSLDTFDDRVKALDDSLKPFRDDRLVDIPSDIVAEEADSPSDPAAENEPERLQLLRADPPRFWRPADPVVMVFGGQRSNKHGQDGRLRSDNTLFCRLSGQTVRQLNISARNLSDAQARSADLVKKDDLIGKISSLTEHLDGQHLPREDIIDLVIESLLLDLEQIPYLCGQKSGSDLAATIRRQQALHIALEGEIKSPQNLDLIDDYLDLTPFLNEEGIQSEGQVIDYPALNRLLYGQLLAPAAGIVSSEQQEPAEGADSLATASAPAALLPSPHGIAAWRPPWSPLFLSWELLWLPSDQNPNNTMDDWAFNPYDGLEYDWIGGRLPDRTHALTISNRVILTDTNLDRLTRHLDDFLRDKIEAAEAEGRSPLEAGLTSSLNTLLAMKEQLKTADILSQSLSGLHNQMLMRDAGQSFWFPEEAISLGDDQTMPLKDLLIGSPRNAPIPFGRGSNESQFHPLRAGHFRLQRLWIIDSFGQVFDPMRARGEASSSFVPLRGRGLSTVGPRQRGDTQVLQLPPRIVQPARLNFRFVPAGSSTDNPICGWLLPNHLDRSLAVFDAAGEALGILLQVANGLAWRSAVGDPTPVKTPQGIGNAPLRAFVDGLLKPHPNAQMGGRAAAQALKDLLEAIDRTLWTIDPLGNRRSLNTSLLIGRPLALVQAALEIEVVAEAARDQRWEPGPVADPDWTATRFPVQLGHPLLREDGTLGYFRQGAEGREINYRQFCPTYPSSIDSASSYLADPDSPDSQLGVPLRFAADPAAAGGSATNAAPVTLLIDPRGSIHARTGILPTKALTVPARFIEEPLERLSVTFRVGPLLTDPNMVRMPLPAEVHGSWRWIEKVGVDLGGFSDPQEIEPLLSGARLSDVPLVIREGWLRLSGDFEK